MPGTTEAGTVNSLVRLMVLVLLFGRAVLGAEAAFSSLYVFGDGVCSSTDNIYGGSLYYPYTYCNGRVWVQVLAQRQGVTYDANKNLSYFGHCSFYLSTDVSQFSTTNANTSLFVVWVNNADFVWDMQNIYPSTSLATWNNAMNGSLANHFQAITNLYAKGARTLIMPNAADITKIPQYSGLASGDKSFIRQRVIDYNTAFAAMLNQASASLPGIKIYMPDMFALFDDLLAHPGNYGLVNPGAAALGDPNLTDYSLNGPGANYVFWDPFDPTAKVHEVAADTVQELISPANITDLALLDGSNRLDIANIPIGLDGFVDGNSNLVSGSWTPVTNFNTTSATQAIFVPTPGPQQFYRLRFPFAWSWP